MYKRICINPNGLVVWIEFLLAFGIWYLVFFIVYFLFFFHHLLNFIHPLSILFK